MAAHQWLSYGGPMEVYRKQEKIIIYFTNFFLFLLIIYLRGSYAAHTYVAYMLN